MKRKKATLSQQWERLMKRREKTLAALVRIEKEAKRLRGKMSRQTKKRAGQHLGWNLAGELVETGLISEKILNDDPFST